MSTYTQILYQIVFSTKYRERVLEKANRDTLFKYISGIIENKKCHLYRINGVEDHVHILCDLHPTIALSDLVKDIKVASGLFIKEQKLFPGFVGWQSGYGAFTYSMDRKEVLINYIMHQEEHHKAKTFKEEYAALLEEHHLQLDERYFL